MGVRGDGGKLGEREVVGERLTQLYKGPGVRAVEAPRRTDRARASAH